MCDRIPKQIEHMNDLVGLSDTDCFDNLRMNRSTFNHICYLLRQSGGLSDSRYVSDGEQVALFLSVLSHHSKVRVVKFAFNRSSQTIHKHFHTVLKDSLTNTDRRGMNPPSLEKFQGLMEGGSTDQVLAKLRNQNDKGRRGWSLQEEYVLAEALKKNCAGGMEAREWVFPNTDIKPEPHITSRLTVWKKNYHSLFEILKHTGVGLDSTTKMVEATDEQWEGFVKVQDEKQDESESPGGYAQTGESSDVEKISIGRKRKAPNTPDPFVSVVQGLFENASTRLGDIAQGIGHDQDMSQARKQIYSSISTMDILTLKEKLRATSLIARSTEYIDVFFSLPDDDRLEWVCMVLSGDI
ncbi:hypothetical protein ACS0TY_030888 [Phlomoides rotata]